MGKRIFVLFLVVLLGVVFGVSIVKKRVQDPILKELLTQQASILASQQKMEERSFSNSGYEPVYLDQDGNALDKDSVEGLGVKMKALEGRVAKLEDQLTSFKKFFEQIKKPSGKQRPTEDFSKVYDIDAGKSPIRGNKDAPVTIVEFVDFQCPFCSRFHNSLLEVLAAYPDKVNYISKHYPLSFHPKGKLASKAVLAAEKQGKYWEMSDALLEDNTNLGEEQFKRVAKELGMNVEDFMDDYTKQSAQWEAEINNDILLGRKLDVRGTPTFFINGRKTRARNTAEFKEEVEQILNKK